MTDSTVAIVGAGDSGLRAATLLAGASIGVTVIERLPEAGGQEPEEGSSALAASAQESGVRFMLGTLAVRWADGRLETLGVEGADVLEPSALIVATGTRPATRGELGLAGDRFAGVLPATAAIHLSEAGVLLGRRPLILGGGSLAASCLRAVRHAGASHVTVVAPDGILAPALGGADAVFNGWSVIESRGNPRTEAVTLSGEERRERVTADVVLLAHRRIPMRNIEGAIGAAERVVSCHSTADPKSTFDSRSTAERAAAETLQAIGSTREGTQCK